jgi:hypothetical protein
LAKEKHHFQKKINISEKNNGIIVQACQDRTALQKKKLNSWGHNDTL